jgi:ABC-2 type transport system permease protein
MFLVVTSLIMFMLLMGDLVLLLRAYQNLYMATLGIIVGLTGVVVPVSDLPLVFESIAYVLPISHGLEAIRDSLAGAGFNDVIGNLALEAAVGLGYALAGYVGFVLVERELKRRGIMEQQGI